MQVDGFCKHIKFYKCRISKFGYSKVFYIILTLSVVFFVNLYITGGFWEIILYHPVWGKHWA